jgi:hypothetical protein
MLRIGQRYNLFSLFAVFGYLQQFRQGYDKPAAKISPKHGFKYLNLECLPKYNLPGLLTETTTAITEDRIHVD